MELKSIFWSLAMSIFNILMIPQSSLSAPIMFLCNKTVTIKDKNSFLCIFDIHTDRRVSEWKTTLNQFTFSINAITGIMLAMIIVIFISIIFNIVRHRSAGKTNSSSTTSLVPQRQSEFTERYVKGNGVIDNNYETPITSVSGIRNIENDNDYLQLERVEEPLYDQLDHEKELVKQGIISIAIVENAVYNEVGSKVVIDDNIYDAVEFKKASVIDNVAYGNLENPRDMVYDQPKHS